MDVRDRLKKFIEYQDITIASFEKRIGASNGYVNSISKGIGSKYLERIREEFPVLNIEWLLTGNGNMKKLLYDEVNEEKSKYEIVSSKKKIPFYDVDFYSGFESLVNDQTIQPSYYFYHPEFEKADFAVKNSGKSMGKIIGPNDIIGMRRVDDWIHYFPQGEVYGLVTSNDMRTIKHVKKSKTNDDLILIPNPDTESTHLFPEFELLPISMVLNFFQVVASMDIKKLSF